MPINKDNKTQVISVGLILLLATALIITLITVNFYQAEKLSNLQAAIQNNANNLANIQSFLNQQIQAASQNQPRATETPATEAGQ
ncbi:hypothetical protein COT94_00620 [Candidatus Falkowbacteria bacterium CG10_big_fil_rev_8_21_14_0_10_37_14]|uniref:Uncharacterized protein n=1 Tax=Candidatus Falkowbacteria bacterium CG10_big_fil_rev_8_21_14_0_10_37_14 TaxID=1974561 RepID=A0A2M6WUM4_9BACT|nr:hypothetical protein [Candidatus Falkowbacteria bacterium]PIT96451.1 MAG: hypothetical protein COT94_00620 [Candidatus Falkowbacteria bacterium CG10_big_fil_rev_8_21_14_0_10_37_14]